MRGIVTLLHDDGVYISENGYVVDMVDGLQYDSIYHEHLRYYSATALAALFVRYGMEIISVEKIPSHGGSIRVYAAKKGAWSVESNVSQILEEESARGFTKIEVYHQFARAVANTKRKLLEIVYTEKKVGSRIVGIGAPAKGNTLLNYCNLDTSFVDYLVEKSPLKIGTYSPGRHIPVVNEANLFTDQPEVAILLSWNLAEELVKKLRDKGYRGKFIVPNPLPHLLSD